MECPACPQAPDPSEALKAGLWHGDMTKLHHLCGASTAFSNTVVVVVASLPLTYMGLWGKLMDKLSCRMF